jgi:hypothetical protein
VYAVVYTVILLFCIFYVKCFTKLELIEHIPHMPWCIRSRTSYQTKQLKAILKIINDTESQIIIINNHILSSYDTCIHAELYE